MKSLHSRVKAKNKKKPGVARMAVAREIMELAHLLLTRNEFYKEERPPRPGSKKERWLKGLKEKMKQSHIPHRASQDDLCARSAGRGQAET